LAAIAVLCLFYVSSTALFAQDESPEIPAGTAETAEVSAEDQVRERIAAAERLLLLGDDAAEPANASSPASVLSILRVLLTLVVVAAAIYGLVFLVKKFSRGGAARDPFLKVLASVPLGGASRSAHIIAVGSQAWLVGSAESGVTLISEIGDKEVLDAMLLEDSRRTAEAQAGGGGLTGRFPDFRTLLHRLGMPADSGAPPGPESIRNRGERLKGL